MLSSRSVFISLVAVAAFGAAGCASKRPAPLDGNAGLGPVAEGERGRDDEGLVGRARPGSQEDLAQSAGDRVYFGYDRWELEPDERQALVMQAQWLARHPAVRVRIEGNCDERGTREYNLALGARRANAAREVLVSRGVDPARIDTISYGKERPLAAGSGESAWARNRNAHTVVISLAPR